MKDAFSRTIDYMRVSLTDRCNYRCVYCMDECGVEKKSHDDILSFEDVMTIIRAFHNLGGKKVRFTGGEPLLRKNAADLICTVKKELPDLCIGLTTNGVYLPKYIDKLSDCIDGLNVSIDSLSDEIYNKITRGGNLECAIQGISAAKNSGIKNIKVNAVLMKGVNDNVSAFSEFAKKHDVKVRFIEMMPIMNEHAFHKYFLPADIFVKENDMKFLRRENKVDVYMTKDGVEIGVIAALQSKFCSSCNRIRLTADGKILPCLHHDVFVDVKPYLADGNVEDAILKAVEIKPREHLIEMGVLQKINMYGIGG